MKTSRGKSPWMCFQSRSKSDISPISSLNETERERGRAKKREKEREKEESIYTKNETGQSAFMFFHTHTNVYGAFPQEFVYIYIAKIA